MSTWLAKCECCGLEMEVEANSEKEAIQRAKKIHEEKQSELTMFHCDMGPMIRVAQNLDCPSHPGAPRDW